MLFHKFVDVVDKMTTFFIILIKYVSHGFAQYDEKIYINDKKTKQPSNIKKIPFRNSKTLQTNLIIQQNIKFSSIQYC